MNGNASAHSTVESGAENKSSRNRGEAGFARDCMRIAYETCVTRSQ